jgi:hypothetical protein
MCRYDEQSIYLTTGSFRDRNANDGGLRYNGLRFLPRTYNYADRYLATFTFRADASSKYQEKWGYFPSVGLGWILTGEEFMAGQNTFDMLKLRASWGLLGNDNVPANSAVILVRRCRKLRNFRRCACGWRGCTTVVQRY